MLKMANRRIGRQGQVTVEVAVLFGAVVAGLVAMAVYVQRGAQGGMKSNADSLGTQFSANDTWQTHSRSVSEETRTKTQSGQTSAACQGVGGASMPANCVAAVPTLPN